MWYSVSMGAPLSLGFGEGLAPDDGVPGAGATGVTDGGAGGVGECGVVARGGLYPGVRGGGAGRGRGGREGGRGGRSRRVRRGGAGGLVPGVKACKVGLGNVKQLEP